MRSCCALGLAIVVASSPARADHHGEHVAAPARAKDHQEDVAAVTEPSTTLVDVIDTSAEPSTISVGRRAAAIGLAVVPGVIVHGAGAWTLGERSAATKLLAGGAIGLGVAGIAGLFVIGSGANPYTIVPGAPLIVGGVGLFLQSWLTDIYVAAAGTRATSPPRALAPWSVEAGTSWLHDAYREYAFMRGGGRVELGRVELAAAALVDATGNAQVGEARVGLRLAGAPATGRTIGDGSRLVVSVGSRVHRDTNDRVTQTTGEVELHGRLDLDRLDPSFGRSFAELGTGLGVIRADYGDVSDDLSSTLLARFAWGAYLGSRGEAMLFYEHTRDGLVGGLPAARAAGFLGSIGASLDLIVHGPWAVRTSLEIGTAYLTTFAVVFRGGPR